MDCNKYFLLEKQAFNGLLKAISIGIQKIYDIYLGLWIFDSSN